MATLEKRSITFNRRDLSNDTLIEIYKAAALPRLIEEKMLILLRQGRISKWFSGYGQEGISVGSTLAMKNDEFILPMHRNLGVFTSRNLPLDRKSTRLNSSHSQISYAVFCLKKKKKKKKKNNI